MKKCVLLLLTLVLIGSMYTISPYKQEETAPVQLIYPTVRDIRDMTILQGQIVDPSPTYLFPRSTALIQKVLVSPGDRVTAGQPLMQLQTDAGTHSAEEIAASALFQIKRDIEAGNYTSAQSMLEGLNTNLDRRDKAGLSTYQLLSPVNGIVMDVFCAEGDTVTSLLPCIELCKTDNLVARAQVDESLIGSLKKDMLCEVSVPAFGLQALHGSITAIMPYAKQSGLLTGHTTAKTTVEITLAKKEQLLPGYRTEIRVITARKPAALLLPYKAIRQDDDGNEYVMILENNSIVKQMILTGSELEDQVEILTGLDAQSLVVADPDTVREGVTIFHEDT